MDREHEAPFASVGSAKDADASALDAAGAKPAARLLAGLRVLDLTNVLSGPFCTYQLALLGAEVIKIEAPQGGDLARQLGADPSLNEAFLGASFIAQNAGKKSVTLDLKSRQGKELFKRLVSEADAVVENFRPGVMDRLGLGFSALSVVNPKVVYCAISGFGQQGPLRDNPAYDQIIQGMSGVMSITGEAASAPLRVGYPVSDTLGGITAAFAIMCALYDSKASGRGRAIDVSMLDSTIIALGWVVSNYLLAGVEPQPMGNENMTAAPSGTFATGEGLLNIAANKQEQFEALCRLMQRTDLITDDRFSHREARKQNRKALTEELERTLSTRAALEWEQQLNAAGVPAGRVLSVPQVLSHPQLQLRRLVQELDPIGDIPGPIRVLRAGFQLSDCEPFVSSPPPRLGEHTEEVLASVGLDASAVAALKAEGII